MSDIEAVKSCLYKKQSLGDKHVFSTPSYIEDIEQFDKLLEVCENAHEDEVIILNVFCYGGSADVTMTVYNALMSTPATVYTINKSVAYSGGSILLLAGQNIGYEPLARTMIHTSTVGYYPDKLPEVETAIESHSKFLKEFYTDVYTGFLTEEEISDVLKGRPVYIMGEEHNDRLERLMEHRRSLYEDFEKEQGVGIPTKEELLKKTKKELVALMVGDGDDDQ